MARKPQPKSATNTTLKKGWKETFIESLKQSPNVGAAALLAGVHRSTAYRERDADSEFSRLWDEALSVAVDNAEGELYRRAVRGTVKPVYQQGRKVGKIREYSDTLLIFLLKSHKPERYRDRVESFNIDLSGLSDDAVDRLSRGDDVRSVLADERASRARAQAQARPSTDQE